MSHRASDGYVTANTTASGTGATQTIRAQSATGTTSTGGSLVLSSGSGTSADGYITLQSGGVTKLNVYSNSAQTQTFLEFDAAANGPRLSQASTANATGTNLNIIAQSAATQGGRIILQPGNGTTGGTIRLHDGKTGNNAMEITPNSTGTTAIAFTNTVAAVSFQHTSTSTANGATMSFNAQSATADTFNGGTVTFLAGSAAGPTSGTGGSVNISANTGVTNGSINFRMGSTTFCTFFQPNPTGAVDMNWVSTVTAPRIIQAGTSVASAVGADFTIQAQNATGTTSTGGSLKLRSGTGTSVDGYVSIFGGNTEITRFSGGRQISLGGTRSKLTNVSATPYAVLATDMNIMVDTTTLAITVNLPATPTAGDTYRIKDSTGNAGANNITVSGNGNNIEGAASTPINTNWGKVTVVYNGTQWVTL